MSASAASLNINEPLVPEIIGQKVEKVTSFLDHVVRAIAGKEEINTLTNNLSDAQKMELHSSSENVVKNNEVDYDTTAKKPQGFRYHLANAFHNVANNNSSIMNTLNGVLSSVYIAGAGVGKPLAGLISKSRRVEQALNLVRRFATGAKINSPSRMLAAFLGLPALFVKNVGEDMYLLNGFQSALGNVAEDCMEAAKDDGVMHKGMYKNFLDEPLALVKKLGKSLGELIQNPTVIADPKWIEKSQMLALGNIGGSVMLGLGLASGNKDFARLGRNLQSVSVDATKTTSNNIERSASALGFGAEMGLDTLNDKLAAGDSTRLSAGVALAGQVARTLGVVYQDTEFNDDLPKIYSNPVGFLQKAIPSILKNGNPISLFTRAKKDLTAKFENLLTGRRSLETVSPELSAQGDLTAAEALAKAPDLETTKSKSRSTSVDYDSLYDTNYESVARNAATYAARTPEEKAKVDEIILESMSEFDNGEDISNVSEPLPLTQSSDDISNISEPPPLPQSSDDISNISDPLPLPQSSDDISNVSEPLPLPDEAGVEVYKGVTL